MAKKNRIIKSKYIEPYFIESSSHGGLILKKKIITDGDHHLSKGGKGKEKILEKGSFVDLWAVLLKIIKDKKLNNDINYENDIILEELLVEFKQESEKMKEYAKQITSNI